jgi:type IX secretion system PorP/SprF family membrane protein
MNTVLRISIFLLLIFGIVRGQDIQLTQFYAMPIYLNPAFAGANVCARFSLTYRNQWPGMARVYQSKLVAMDHAVNSSNLGIGLMVGQDEAGIGVLKTTVINPAISYEARIGQLQSIRFGLQPGVTIKSINMDKLLFGDQIYRGAGSNVATIESYPQSRTYFDAAAGVIYVFKHYWGGLTVSHLNRPNESFYNIPSARLPVKFSAHAGAKFDLNKLESHQASKKYITPIIHYRAQKEFDQVDVGFYYSQNVFVIGLWYRGIPLLKAYAPGYANNDAVAFIIGVQLPRFRVGYSFDNTISELAGLTKGAHEVTLAFQLCKMKRKKKKHVLISCPKF